MKLACSLGLVAITVLAGCSHRRDLPGVRSSVVERADGAVQYATVRNDLALVVWSAPGNVRSGVAADSATATTPDSVRITGSRETGDPLAPSTRISWSLTTSDGVTGDVTVNDRPFRLENGGVFVVAGAEVTQVKHSLAGLRPSDETWSRLARDVPEVRAFRARQLGVRR